MAEKTQATMLSFFTKKAPIDGEITNEVPNMENLNILPRKSELGPSYPDIALLSRESLAKNDIKTAFEKYLG